MKKWSFMCATDQCYREFFSGGGSLYLAVEDAVQNDWEMVNGGWLCPVCIFSGKKDEMDIEGEAQALKMIDPDFVADSAPAELYIHCDGFCLESIDITMRVPDDIDFQRRDWDEEAMAEQGWIEIAELVHAKPGKSGRFVIRRDFCPHCREYGEALHQAVLDSGAI